MTRASKSPWVFLTDLDGTLLDHATYQWDAARPALAALARRRLPLILVTSKTRVEVQPLVRALGFHEPFVVENGGATFVPDGYFAFPIEGSEPAGKGWRQIFYGTKRELLCRELERAARRARVKVRGFADMNAREVAQRTGLAMPEARRALARECDEPFVILEGGATAWPRLKREIRRAGLVAARGGRFFHILGENDKGTAIHHLLAWYCRAGAEGVRSVGLGDSPNDIPLLRAVDFPVLVARPGGRYDRETLAAVPGARRAGGVGPAGWNRAVLRLLGEVKLSRGVKAPGRSG